MKRLNIKALYNGELLGGYKTARGYEALKPAKIAARKAKQAALQNRTRL